MGEKAFDILGPELVGMSLTAAVVDIAAYPLTIGLLGAVGVVVIAQHFTHLIHELKARIGMELR